jgi:hypothetical protein
MPETDSQELKEAAATLSAAVSDELRSNLVF